VTKLRRFRKRVSHIVLLVVTVPEVLLGYGRVQTWERKDWDILQKAGRDVKSLGSPGLVTGRLPSRVLVQLLSFAFCRSGFTSGVVACVVLNF
jgi:hypothetical protein